MFLKIYNNEIYKITKHKSKIKKKQKETGIISEYKKKNHCDSGDRHHQPGGSKLA